MFRRLQVVSALEDDGRMLLRLGHIGYVRGFPYGWPQQRTPPDRTDPGLDPGSPKIDLRTSGPL